MPNVYKKRTPTTPIYTSVGRPIYFEDTGFNYGFYRTDDPTLIAEFTSAIQNNRGGLTLSSEEEYAEALKKKPSYPRPNGLLIREMQTSGLLVPPQVKEDLVVSAVVAAPAPSAPTVAIEAPAPKLGKRKV